MTITYEQIVALRRTFVGSVFSTPTNPSPYIEKTDINALCHQDAAEQFSTWVGKIDTDQTIDVPGTIIQIVEKDKPRRTAYYQLTLSLPELLVSELFISDARKFHDSINATGVTAHGRAACGGLTINSPAEPAEPSEPAEPAEQ